MMALVLYPEAKDRQELEAQLDRVFAPSLQSTCRHCNGPLTELQFGHYRCQPCALRKGKRP
ncbi:hypothetical protein [Deinococcus peraridilitoris]|uniref:Uncharacterized protein n=1 Tax=Deinococcus peraridilitoris (strain DSM 19664 / LMG 22246 / CIP 109416 / KR-200) TaxID=937777 RepID=L0A301_DEIPD|nr:hypothetical protein [Deinococcus peraridilitoris]AFZ67557.1 hypothetical protein Deipe_2061 [Deinococcus peraridilitoris DSM 19664]